MKNKFCFFHPYLPEIWQAMIDCGLVADGDGVRFSQSLLIREEYKFNNLAAKGTEIYNYVKEHKAPFYIDRLQGGCYIEEYPYDMELVDEYRSMLGDNFKGFQMHEWIPNYRSDLAKLGELSDEEFKDPEIIKQHILKKYPYPCLFLESMSAEEMAEHGKPRNIDEFLSNIFDIYKKDRAHMARLSHATAGSFHTTSSLQTAQKLLCPRLADKPTMPVCRYAMHAVKQRLMAVILVSITNRGAVIFPLAAISVTAKTNGASARARIFLLKQRAPTAAAHARCNGAYSFTDILTTPR